MKSYSESAVFDSWTLEIYHRARTMVELLDAPEGKLNGRMIRCHELARAVARLINDASLTLVDGKYGVVDHSWLSFVSGHQLVILDVYACGRLPQVQLVDTFFGLPHLASYVAGPMRDDIDLNMVTALVQRMRAWLPLLDRIKKLRESRTKAGRSKK